MIEQWQRLENWFSVHCPEMVSDLNAGFTPDEIRELENSLGMEVPDSFKGFYSRHNGQKAAGYIGMFYDISLLSLKDILSNWQLWVSILDSYSEAEFEETFDQYQVSLMPSKVKAKYANKRWIPFAVIWDSCYLGLDFDPASDGVPGQVINFGREEEQKAVLANSFEEFVDKYMKNWRAATICLTAKDNICRSSRKSLLSVLLADRVS